MKTIIKVRNMNPVFSPKKISAGSAMALSILMSLPWAVTACNGQKQTLNSSGGKNMKFRFEDYEKAEDAEKKILEFFPIGSEYNKAVTELESFEGMKCLKSQKSPSISCEYFVRISSITSFSWSVFVTESNNKISELKVYKTPSAL
jgi:hypothetical protein